MALFNGQDMQSGFLKFGMKKSVSVGPITAAPGEKKFGYVKIGESPAFDISLPVGIVNGTEDGPRICLIAGTHPCEYPGIDATIRLYQETNPKELRGAMVTVPVVNVLGFDRYISYVSPLDGSNMHFQTPGKLDGNFSQLTNYLPGEDHRGIRLFHGSSRSGAERTADLLLHLLRDWQRKGGR